METTLFIQDIHIETSEVRTFCLDNSRREVTLHRPGQHLKIGVETPSGLAWKSFSICSPPTRPDSIDLTVQRKPEGVVSRTLHAMEIGQTVVVKEPSGQFFLDIEVHIEPLVLIAGGMGITPIMSILRTLRDLQNPCPIQLFYGCHSLEKALFARELHEISQDLGNFHWVRTLSRPDESWTGATGRIGPELLADQVDDPLSKRFYVCGPGDFNCSVAKWLTGHGVRVDRIHEEAFGKRR